MNTNYHTHNELCGHAGGTLEEYVQEAIRNQFTEIGMSDHIPFRNDWGCRMPFDSLDYYTKETKRLQSSYCKDIKVLLGGEIEYFKEEEAFYHQLLEEMGFEYLLLAGHFFQSANGHYLNCYDDCITTAHFIDYAKHVNNAMDTGLFACLAHPDLPFIKDVPYDDNIKRMISLILENATKHDYILEVNANGFRREMMDSKMGMRYPYPTPVFWEEVAKTNIRVIIGSDCHSLDALCDDAIIKAEKWCKDFGLNLIHHLDI